MVFFLFWKIANNILSYYTNNNNKNQWKKFKFICSSKKNQSKTTIQLHSIYFHYEKGKFMVKGKMSDYQRCEVRKGPLSRVFVEDFQESYDDDITVERHQHALNQTHRLY